MGSRRWTEEDFATLERFLDLETDVEIGRRLGRSASAVAHKRQQLRQKATGKKRHQPRWTKEDLAIVLTYWGTESGKETAARVGRSYYAVRKKIWKVFGSGGVLRGRWTINKLIAHSGYDYYQITKAIEALDIQTKRSIAGGTYRPYRLFNQEQAERILEWLKERTVMPDGTFISRLGNPVHSWGRFYDRCQNCGTNGNSRSERHCANGLCESCYRIFYVRPREVEARKSSAGTSQEEEPT